MEKSFAQRDLFWQEIKENKRKLFSLIYNGAELGSADLACEIKNTQKDKNKEITTLSWSLPESSVKIELQFSIFEDFPYLEYETFITNDSSDKSKIIEEVKMLSLAGSMDTPYYGEMIIKKWDFSNAGSRIKVSYFLGSYCSARDFIRIDRRLYPQEGESRLLLSSEEASRPSERAMPFFRVDFDDLNGYDIGVGWSGNWMADISFTDAMDHPFIKMGNNWQIASGMVKTRFSLEAGEKLRMPGYFIGFRNDIPVRDFINTHRKFMLAHHAPRNSKGELILPPLSIASWGGVETENMKKVLKLVKEKNLPFEVHWIDAGWQGKDGPCPHFCDETEVETPNNWYNEVGNERINRFIHPNGLSEIADFGRECGLKTMLWIEPERYSKYCNSPLFEEHPEWFLDNLSTSYAFDLGNDEACKWLINWTLNFLDRERIDYYRQDENMNFRGSWNKYDAPDRIGTHEMKHINNLYKFWSALREARPDMLIDNCASGGRRLDYMLASLSFPLCQSDYETYMHYNYSCVHIENYFLNEVYPLHSTLSWMPDGDSYAIFSGGCGLGIGSKRWQFPARYPKEDFDYDTYRTHLLAIKDMRELLVKGNYYQLSSEVEDLSRFCAMQAHDEKEEKGFIIVFRRPETLEEDFIAILPEIDPKGEYEVKEFGKEEIRKVSGEELRFFRKNMPEKRSVALLFYKKI